MPKKTKQSLSQERAQERANRGTASGDTNLSLKDGLEAKPIPEIT
jgi:hypothetical protein